MKKKQFSYCTMLVISLLFYTGCTSYSVFNQRSYEMATALKVDALELLNYASEPFSEHQDEIKLLKRNVEKAYQYAKGLPDNPETVKQWDILKNPNGFLLFGALNKWEAEGTLSPGFISSIQPQIEEAFDSIIELESGKRKPEN